MKLPLTLNLKFGFLVIVIFYSNSFFLFCKENKIETIQNEEQTQNNFSKQLKYEIKSPYSHIKVYDENKKNLLLKEIENKRMFGIKMCSL
jgi:hypothetical protein